MASAAEMAFPNTFPSLLIYGSKKAELGNSQKTFLFFHGTSNET